MLRRAIVKNSRAFTRSLPSSSRSLSLSPPSSFPSFKLAELQRRFIQPLSSFTSRSPQQFQRWQSTEAEQKSPDNPHLPEESNSTEAEEEDPLSKELETKNREIIDLKDRYLRSVAEFRNLQDRTKRDIDSARQFAIQRFASDLVESIDNLDRALEAVPSEALQPASSSTSSSSPATEISESPNKDLVNLHSGLKMTESILMATLKKHGLVRFDPVVEGRKFDPRLDEATFMTKVEGKEDGEVFLTQSKGFTLNGRVLRAAKVGVVKNT